MKESSYAGKEARDDIKKDLKYSRLSPDAKKAADKELEKGGMVDLGEQMLEEMEFFSVSIEVPEELPDPDKLLTALSKEAENLVDNAYIEVSDLSITVAFMRKSDAENYKEFARSLGIPEENVNEPETDVIDQEEDKISDMEEIEEVVMDSVGNELFLEDTINVAGRKFIIKEGEDGKAHLFSEKGHQLLPISNPKTHILLRKSIKENLSDEYDTGDLDVGHVDDEPDMLKAYVYEIIDYGIKLYKQLDVYDRMPQEVDFPNWWQAKVIKARDYISSAQHYLEFESKQPGIDAALQELDVPVDKKAFKDQEMEFELGREEYVANVEIVINDKTWKVLPGTSKTSPDVVARAHKIAAKIKDRARREGRKVPKVEVYLTGAKPTTIY